jgi:putative protein kinase ArgK-like GTPase of G3E family
MATRSDPTLPEILKMITSVARGVKDLQDRLAKAEGSLAKLEASPRPKPQRMTKEAWLAQRRELAANARAARAKAARPSMPIQRKKKKKGKARA